MVSRCQRSFVESKSQHDSLYYELAKSCQRSFVESKSQLSMIHAGTGFSCQRSFVCLFHYITIDITIR